MRAWSLHQGSTTPSGITACTVGSAAIMRSPCLSSARSRMTSGRSMLAM